MWITSGRSLQPGAVSDLFEGDTLQNELELSGIDWHTGRMRENLRELEGAFLEPFVIDSKTISFPKQQLNLCAAAIHKNKYCATQGIQRHTVLDHSAQAIKTFTHIRMSAVQIILTRSGKM